MRTTRTLPRISTLARWMRCWLRCVGSGIGRLCWVGCGCEVLGLRLELYRRQDEATRLAAGGARPILEVVGPLAELNDDPWVDVVRRLEAHARRLGSTCRAFPSGSAITIQLASPWPMSIRVGPEEVETVDLRLLITVERWSEVEMQPVLPGLRHQWRTTPT